MEPVLRNIETAVSEYSFSNIFLFRHEHSYHIFERDGHTFITGHTYDDTEFVMLTKNPEKLDVNFLAALAEEFGMIYPVPEEWLPAFPENRFSRSFKDGDSDYIHEIEKLETYRGRRLHKKRNLLKQFFEKYEWKSFHLEKGHLDEARSILEDWQRDMGMKPEETDYCPCRDAMDHYDELNLCGGIFYAEGRAAGFIIGEELTDDVFALHFAKGRREIKGIYQFMFNNFARVMPEQYRYFNFEQDLGKESLRQAKASYLPEKMLIKYRITLR